jgi:hypothetical protein
MSFLTRLCLAELLFTIDLLLFFVPLARPAWLPRLVEKIYSEVS